MHTAVHNTFNLQPSTFNLQPSTPFRLAIDAPDLPSKGGVNAGEKMHRRAAVKMHRGGMPDGPAREAFLASSLLMGKDGWQCL
jgi:hypothetical protein